MLAHLRTEAYPVYRRHQYPPNLSEPPALARGNFSADGAVDYERNNLLIDEAKSKLESGNDAV